MPIDTGAVPPAAIAAVEQAMKARLAHSAFTTSNLRQVTSGALHRSFPHRVAYLSLDQVRRGRDLREATQPAGWRFLIQDGDKVMRPPGWSRMARRPTGSASSAKGRS